MDTLQIENFLSLPGDLSISLPLPAGTHYSPEPSDDRSASGISRPFRTRPRNPRSCDFCRARKTACILENGPPCTTCRGRGRRCEFTERSTRRNGRDQSTAYSALNRGAQGNSRSDYNSVVTPPAEQSRSFNQPSFNITGNTPPQLSTTDDQFFSDLDVHIINENEMVHATDQPEADSSSGRCVPDHENDFGQIPQHMWDESLDLRPTSTAFLLGETGEADPYLLKDSNLAAHADNIQFRRIYRERVPDGVDQGLDNERPLVLMLGEHSLYSSYEPRVEEATLAEIRKSLDKITKQAGVRLVKLFFKFVYVYFPILSRSQMLGDDSHLSDVVSNLPLSLKAAIYASALPFMVYDDFLSTILDVDPPSSQNLWRMAWQAITHEIHTPHLSTLQASLLLIQRDNQYRFVQGSPFQWSLVAWTVGMAQTLGLSTDCSTWRGLPAWEKRLRKRLWWATFVLDKWILLCSGLPSHIRIDDFDVLPLTASDFFSDVDPSVSPEERAVPTQEEMPHFHHLVELTIIMSDMNDAFFSIRATRSTASNLGLSLEKAMQFRANLSSWKESYDRFMSCHRVPSTPRARLDSNISLGLAYPVVTMLLFRALLRPLENSNGTPEDKLLRESSRESIRIGAEACCVEIVNCLERIESPAWNAFWHKFSPNFFAMASSFMMRLVITSRPQDDTSKLTDLIERWRWAMRTGGGNMGNAMMSLALLRLDRTLLTSGYRSSDMPI